ncbi:hypothetical protein BDV12DRAFT_201502 [Aspergillus spectabilis]
MPDPEELMLVYRTMAQTDEANSNIWRSQTLQNFSKSAGTETKSFEQQRINSICSELLYLS